MNTTNLKEIAGVALRFVDYINRQNLDNLTALMTDDFTFVSLDGTREQGRDRMRSGWTQYFADYPAYRIFVAQINVTDQTVLLLGHTTGSHVQQTPEIEFHDPAYFAARIENSQIAEWRIYDASAYLSSAKRKQLGITPQNEVFDPPTLVATIDMHLQLLPPDAKTADIRAVRRHYSKRLKHAAACETVAVVRKLLFDYGHRFVAYELLFYHDTALQSLNAKEIEELGTGIDDWSPADIFAHFVAGPAWRAQQISDDLVHTWACSTNRWWRRAALVSTIYLYGDVPRTLHLCQMLAGDHNDMIVKALSWTLRELIGYDRQAVEQFLAKHNDILAARVKREVHNKLTILLKISKRKRS